MSLKPSLENTEDESFIILDSSPGNSLKCHGVLNGGLDKSQIEDAMRDLSLEASASYQARFNLVDNPSAASMMAASSIITEDQSTEELQKRFGELLDENVILKETLRQNNDSLKEQYLLIASCQDDMLKTASQHRGKFEETKQLIEKLRLENKKLKQDLSSLAEPPPSLVNGETGEMKPEPAPGAKSGPSSCALEFVTSPEDDTIDKLTSQLELVEKQRRQVITDNEKLTWQKESLEHIVDATSRERDDLREKLKLVELQLSTKKTEHDTEKRELNYNIDELQKKLEIMTISPEQLVQRDNIIRQLEDKSTALFNELKSAKLEILKSENVKMELADYKTSVQEIMKIQKDNILDLRNRLKQASTTVFQPVRLSVSTEPAEGAGLAAKVKVYDRTLKHLAELLNRVTHGLSDSLVETLGVILSLHEFGLDRSTEPQFKEGLATVRLQLERQHSDALSNVGQIRGTMSIFEDIFKDYKELLNNAPTQEIPSGNMEALTSALVARGQELQQLQGELTRLRTKEDDTEHLKAQLEIYRSDFEAERQAREKMASEKDALHTDLRKAQRRAEELGQQLEEVRRLNPIVHRNATSKGPQPPPQPARPTPARTYKCPKCLMFSTQIYSVLEEHLDFCLDDF